MIVNVKIKKTMRVAGARFLDVQSAHALKCVVFKHFDIKPNSKKEEVKKISENNLICQELFFRKLLTSVRETSRLKILIALKNRKILDEEKTILEHAQEPKCALHFSAGFLTISLKERAEDGKANKRLINLLSKEFNVNFRAIKIKNPKSRNKIVEIKIPTGPEGRGIFNPATGSDSRDRASGYSTQLKEIKR